MSCLRCATPAKGDDAAAAISGNVEVRRLDLQDLASVREFADGVTDVDVLVNNAGIMAVPHAVTKDGFESQIATNHLGHFALTNLLLPKIGERGHHLVGVPPDWQNQPRRPELAGTAVPAMVGVRPVEAGQPAVHQRAAAPPRRGRLAATSTRRPPRLLVDESAGRRRKWRSRRHPAQAGRPDGHRRRLRGRPTLFAVSQDLPGDTYVGPRFGYLGRTQPVGRSRQARQPGAAKALWELSEQLTGTEFPL